MGRENVREYWEEQLSEYWSSGFSIPEYCELKDLGTKARGVGSEYSAKSEKRAQGRIKKSPWS